MRPPSPQGSLRGRILAAYVLLALAVCALFAWVVILARQQIDLYLVEHRLALVAQWRLSGATPGGGPEMTPEIAFYRGAGMPAAMARLKPGLQEIVEGRRTLDVLIGVAPDGERYAAVDLVSDFERIERQVQAGLLLCIVAAALLAALLARITAGRVIAPVTALARAVEQGRLGEAAALLSRNDEIGVLARAFAARTDELQRFLLREQLFTGDVSHELRTPLTVILGAAEVLQAQPAAASTPQARAALERITRTARSTADRVGALLLLSRAPERLSMPLLALQPLIEREIERSRPLLAGKPVQIEFRAEPGVGVFAQPQLAEMAIGNLLRNACQYTESGHILLVLAGARLCIEDTGPGLPERVRAQLFERLDRPATEGLHGAGLGLALVKRIAEHLGWEIRFEQPQGGGSRFIFRFPA